MGGSFSGATWEAWRAALSGAFGLPLSGKRLDAFKRLAGGRRPPQSQVREFYAVAGRRSAKSNVSAGVAVYLATVGAEQILSRLSPGETPVVALLAVDRYQARVLSNYIGGILENSPLLSRMVAKSGTEAIELVNGVRIEVFTNNYRAVRGRTLLAVILDECAFYRSDQTASPDIETYRAVVPSLATTGGLLIGVSSPYAQKGLLWQKHRQHFGKSGDVLVVQGGTLDFNPTLPKRIIDEAMEDDPEAAKAEWLGQFRNDIASFVQREVVDACVIPGRYELPFLSCNSYRAFCDPSGGSSDSMTLCIGHEEGQTIVIDAIREAVPPFSPEAVVAEFSELMREYRISRVEGDRYGGEWPRERFSVHRITYDVARKPRTELYKDTLPLLNSKRVELLDNDRLVAQFCGLERRAGRAGRDAIDHAPGANDDLCNAVAGLVASTKPKRKRAGTW
ncbi:terminase large subunit domain-containing protein [Wenzhouxiangella sp. EGI_FJ10409]|uniref:terminase large subunit domain-containing protein n=1 Tax=Wenzhouxiangella sp. EGI_FJ10409 TaxID=3243767 RepID=UPI0035DDC3F9